MAPWAVVALLAVGQIPLATEAELPDGQKVTLAADQLLYEPARETLIARGNTLLQAKEFTLRADEVIYDQSTQQAWARGNVMFVSGLMAAVAEEVHVDVRTLEANVKGGLFLRKRNVTTEQLLAARTPYELKKTGETVLTITGSRIKKVGENEFLVDGLSFTPCDCDPTEPSWRVEAASAEVELGEKAILSWPVVYVQQVPVFALPWLYVPLSERRTGILIPRPNYSSLNGFSFEQPFFMTLGDSYDVTLTPGYFFGARGDDNVAAPFGIRGPRLHTELRYRPTEEVDGRATVGLLYDFRYRRDPLNPGLSVASERGVRGEASWFHTQDMGKGWRNRIDAGFVTDGYYFNDLTTDVLARQAEYLRSTAVLLHRDTMSWFGVDAVVRQPLFSGGNPYGFDVLRPDITSDGQVLHGPRTFARFPAVTWAMPQRTLAGPVWGGFRAEYTRLAPLFGTFGDEGLDGIYRNPLNPQFANDVGQDDGDFDAPTALRPGEREARDRIDLRPELSLPLTSRYASLTPYLAYRQTVYFGEATGQLSQRGYPLAGAALDTTVWRDFGKGAGAVRHTVTPQLEMRSVPFVVGRVPGQPYDEVDTAIPTGGLWQGVAQLRQELGVHRDGRIDELLMLELGQGYDFQAAQVADTFGRLRLRQGPLSMSATLRYDIPTRTPTQIQAGLNLDNGKGTAVYLAYDNLIDVGSDPLRSGIDALVGRPLSLVPGTVGDPGARKFRRAQQLVGGIRGKFPFGLGVRYDAVIQPAAERKFAQQVVGLSYGPGCDCWRLEVHAVLQPDRSVPQDRFLGAPFLAPNFGASLSIREFGSFGAGG